MNKKSSPRWTKGALAVVTIALVVSQSACTEEKAKAVQVGAQAFSSEAKQALGKVRDLYLASASSPDESVEARTKKVIEDIEGLGSSELNSVQMAELMKGTAVGERAAHVFNEEFDRLDKAYSTFAGMYDSLVRGRLFAKKAVKESEAYAITLTVQLVNIAETIGNAPRTNMGRRVLLIDSINKARAITDESQRKEALDQLARQVVQLEIDERKANNDAIIGCLRAAEAGKHVSELIRDYDKLSVGDILALTGEALGFAKDITGSADVEELLKKYTKVRDGIKSDPYWSPLLDRQITGGGN